MFILLWKAVIGVDLVVVCVAGVWVRDAPESLWK